MCKLKKTIAVGISIIFIICSLIPPKTAQALTIKQENELADEFLRAVFAQYEIIKDPVIDNYINEVGQKIVSKMPPQPFSYKFYAVHQDAYNAFAGPAGNIFVFSGLFEALESEDELAALLSHEIAHVACRHISEMITKNKKTSMATLAGVVAGILIGLGGTSAIGSALTIGSMAAGQSVALAYSRENEMQADQIGQTYLQAAGYDLNGLLSVLKKIRAVGWFDTGEIPTYLKTHPATEERIIYLDNLLENEHPLPQKQNYEFQRAHTRLIALYGYNDTAMQRFAAVIKKNPENSMANYGYGLLLERNGNPKAAIDYLKTALQHHPQDDTLKVDLGRVFFLAGEYSNSINTLKPISDGGPERYIYLGQSQVEVGKYEEASETFNQLLTAYPDNTDALLFLGKTDGKLGKLASAHFNLGKYYAKKNDSKTATFHFKKALDYEKDPDQIKKIHERLKDLEDSHRFF
ncbi:MAG: M48 family metalloprotease [Dissulfuribacterales bacterium]